jgi:UrcA family protein
MNMYRSITACHGRLGVALGAACVVGLLPVASFALGADDTRSVRIHYQDLNLDTEAGASALYSRLTRAVKDVCGSEEEIIDISQLKDIESCRRQSLANAVKAVDRPMLTAVYDTHHPGALVATTRSDGGPATST